MKINSAHVRNGAFLLATLLAVAGELWNAFDDSPATRPWTDYLTELPLWVLAPLAVAFSVWLPLHLIEYRRRKTNAGIERMAAQQLNRVIEQQARTINRLRDGM
jgi:hypothetical protein